MHLIDNIKNFFYKFWKDDGVMAWGKHLIFDARGCRIDAITDRDCVASFAKSLVKAIDMVAYGEQQVIHFGEGNKAGFTLVQLIETSNICAHFCNETGDVYLDVFSCKPFDERIAVQVFCDYFKPKDWNYTVLDRGDTTDYLA